VEQSPSVNNVNTLIAVNLGNAILLGLIASVSGATIALLVIWFNKRKQAKAQMPTLVQSQSIPDGAAEVLDVLATAGMVLDGSNTVLRATTGAQAYGLVQNRLLIHSALVDLVDRARESGEPEHIDTELSTGLRGEVVFVHARAARLGSRYVMLLVDDRTESRRLEETRRDFVANISHELKTPIGAVSLLAEALQDAVDDPIMVKKFAANLQRESSRLASLVQDIIQLSRLQSAETVANASLIDLSAVVAEAVERNHFLAENKQIRIRVDAPRGHMIYGDHEMLSTAVKNLIENAILYSESGGQVGVGLRNVNGVAEISVADNGVGIPTEEQERIFERFYRVDASRSRQTGGTGLGLSIVKHVAMNHRGEVRLFSQPGLGSTFTLRLPVADNNVDDLTEKEELAA
jgi:two-component system sensor histidine kinase SenX3